jgi:aconitase B
MDFLLSSSLILLTFAAAGKLLQKHEGQLPTRLWVAPPTRMDAEQLVAEGYYSTYGKVGARTEMPGCSLCMGNQARIADKSTAVSTSTRNFPNRLGKGADVFLSSAELAAIVAIEGKLPTVDEYMKYSEKIHATASDTYRCRSPIVTLSLQCHVMLLTDLNFDRLPTYVTKGASAEMGDDYTSALEKELARLKSQP